MKYLRLKHLNIYRTIRKLQNRLLKKPEELVRGFKHRRLTSNAEEKLIFNNFSFKTLCTLFVLTATPERKFFSLKRIKTHSWNGISEV